MKLVIDFIFRPKTSYPDSWKPAFVAMQLGFLAGALGLLLRDLFIIYTIENWELVVLTELAFGVVVGIGFLLHTLGRAALGVLIACLGGIGSATAFLILLGWNGYFHLWYLNLAILLIAVPINIWIKSCLALSFISLYVFMFFFYSNVQPIVAADEIVLQLIAISNIVGSLLMLGLPMALYSHYLVEERIKSERLLHNIIPKDLANILRESDGVIALDNPNVSVMFADIVGFTQLAEKMSARQVVDLLNKIFFKFDTICEEYGIEKIKTIGDAYMAVSGLPRPRQDHAQSLIDVGFEFLETIASQDFGLEDPLQIRVGIHSGDAVSGVIGKSKFSFDIWGDSVNLASRLQTSGKPGFIHASQETVGLIDQRKLNIEKQVVNIKGKGEITSFLIQLRSESKVGDIK